MEDVLLAIVSFCTFISYLPQVIEIIKTKSSEDISITSWILWVVSSLAYTLYAVIYSESAMLIFETCLELFFYLLILTLTIIYDKSLRKTKNSE